MQIGFPTDVKHVAHIGMDGQSSSSPGWQMTGFKSVPELANQTSTSSNGPLRNSAKYAVEDVTRKAAAEVEDSQTRNEKAKHKTRRKTSAGNSSPTGSPTRQGATEGTKQKRHSASKTSSESTGSEKSNTAAEKSNPGAESSSNNDSKQSRRKKTKGSNSGGATKGGKSKGHSSSSDTTLSSDNESGEFALPTKNNNPLSPISETKQEEKG